MATWATDQRVIARRAPRSAGKQAKRGEDPDWEYCAFTTNTATGQVQWLDARHRTQAHVEDWVKQFKACGAHNLPSIDDNRNATWLQLATLATSLTAWLRHLALDGDLAKSATKTLRFRLLSAPGRLVIHARRKIPTISPGWEWGHDLATACKPCTPPNPRPTTSTSRPNRGTRRPPEHIETVAIPKISIYATMIRNLDDHGAMDQRE
jgi:hypothetical protein